MPGQLDPWCTFARQIVDSGAQLRLGAPLGSPAPSLLLGARRTPGTRARTSGARHSGPAPGGARGKRQIAFHLGANLPDLQIAPTGAESARAPAAHLGAGLIHFGRAPRSLALSNPLWVRGSSGRPGAGQRTQIGPRDSNAFARGLNTLFNSRRLGPNSILGAREAARGRRRTGAPGGGAGRAPGAPKVKPLVSWAQREIEVCD